MEHDQDKMGDGPWLPSGRRFSNTERYTRPVFVGSTRESSQVTQGSLLGMQVVLVPGVFPQCALCGKDCRTLANEDKHILCDSDQTQSTPLLCLSCRSIVCQECARARQGARGYKTCPHCGASDGLAWVLPFAFCDTCGKRAALLSGAVSGQATFQLLDQGTVPFRCTDCGAITCAACLAQKNVCRNCRGTNLGIFLPGYDGKDAIFTEVEGCHVSVGMPGSKVAQQARSSASQCTEEETQALQGAIAALQAPAIKFWINREEALKRLIAMGSKAAPALDVVVSYLQKPAFRVWAIRVLAAAGPSAAKTIPALLEMLKGVGDDASAAALALAAVSQSAREEARSAIPALHSILQRKRGFLGGNLGLRCCAAIALFSQGQIDSETATQIVREFGEIAMRDPSLFPPGEYLQEILVIK